MAPEVASAGKVPYIILFSCCTQLKTNLSWDYCSTSREDGAVRTLNPTTYWAAWIAVRVTPNQTTSLCHHKPQKKQKNKKKSENPDRPIDGIRTYYNFLSCGKSPMMDSPDHSGLQNPFQSQSRKLEPRPGWDLLRYLVFH